MNGTALLLSILLVGYSPGPANLFALAVVLRDGRRAALRTWLGLLAGYTCAATICVLAVRFFGLAFGAYVPYLRYVGAAYLLYLAYRTYRTRGQPAASDRAGSFRDGFIVQFTNAKIILYELSVYATFVLPHSDRLRDLFTTAALLALAGPGANLAWLLAGSYLRRLFVRHLAATNTILAILLAVCALWIAIL
jgi:cysteine/O-acetylserine efflux protein